MKGKALPHLAHIIEKDEVGPGVFRFTFNAPRIARTSAPGQFVHVRSADSLDPFLRRPFSIYSVDTKSGFVSILFQKVGRGTAILSRATPGEWLDVQGPLGRGFSLPEEGEALLIGGGLGVAPLVFLGQELARRGIRGTALIGAVTARMVFGARELDEAGFQVSISTEDGTLEYKGLVTDLLRDRLIYERSRFTKAFMVGPVGMLRSCVETLKPSGLPIEVSLEERMACGVGACLGCAVKVRRVTEHQGFTYARVCRDGPVFDAREVFLDE